MTTRPNGRPTLLTDELADQICALLAEGNYMTTAARAVGIHPDTAYTWRNRGTPGTSDYDELGPYSSEQTEAITNGADIPVEDGLFVRFAEAAARAEAAAEVHAVGVLHKGMEADPRWAVEWLKRKHPDRWREETRIDASVSSTTEHQVTITPAAEQLLETLEAMERHGLLGQPPAELEAGQEGDP